MNRKFVKENKQVLKEFIGKLLANILVKKNKRELDKVIAADPTLKNKKQDMIRLRKSIESKKTNRGTQLSRAWCIYFNKLYP